MKYSIKQWETGYFPQSSLRAHLFWAQMLSKHYGQNAENPHMNATTVKY